MNTTSFNVGDALNMSHAGALGRRYTGNVVSVFSCH